MDVTPPEVEQANRAYLDSVLPIVTDPQMLKYAREYFGLTFGKLSKLWI